MAKKALIMTIYWYDVFAITSAGMYIAITYIMKIKFTLFFTEYLPMNELF